MISAKVVEVFDLEDTDDPVLRGKRFFERGELRALRWESGAADTVDGLAWWEEAVVVVV